jgi:hypothetical protein
VIEEQILVCESILDDACACLYPTFDSEVPKDLGNPYEAVYNEARNPLGREVAYSREDGRRRDGPSRGRS